MRWAALAALLLLVAAPAAGQAEYCAAKPIDCSSLATASDGDVATYDLASGMLKMMPAAGGSPSCLTCGPSDTILEPGTPGGKVIVRDGTAGSQEVQFVRVGATWYIKFPADAPVVVEPGDNFTIVEDGTQTRFSTWPNGIYIPVGSAGAPSLVFSGRWTTGLYSSGASSVSVAGTGAEALRVTGGSGVVNRLDVTGGAAGAPVVVTAAGEANAPLQISGAGSSYTEIQGCRFYGSLASPPGSPVACSQYFDSTIGEQCVYSGSTWASMAGVGPCE